MEQIQIPNYWLNGAHFGSGQDSGIYEFTILINHFPKVTIYSWITLAVIREFTMSL